MAPKGKEAGPQVDSYPYGAFVNVAVQSGALALAKPPKPATPPQERGKSAAASSGARKTAAEAAAAEGPPQTHVVVSYSDDWGPLCSMPMPEEAGVYQYTWEGRFRCDPTIETMHELINRTIRVAVHDSRTNMVLASADLDLLEFGLGASQIDPGTISLTPNAAVPQSTYKALSAELHGVRVWLTHRPLPPPSREASAQQQAVSSPPNALSRSNTNKQHRESQGHPVDQDSLTEPQPYSFISPQLAKGCNVIELQVKGGVSPLPPTLPAAVQAATDSKAGNALHLNLGLQLPGGGPSVVLHNGILTSGPNSSDGGAGNQAAHTHAPPGLFAPTTLAFDPPRQRVFMSASHVQALVEMLEDGGQLQCEVARLLVSETLADPAWQSFRGVAEVPRSGSLILPGATGVQQEAQEACPLHAVPEGFVSPLPQYAPLQGKGVKLLEEGLPPTPPECAWAEVGSCIHGLSVRFARPLVPAWRPPPSRPLTELLPPQPQLQPYSPPMGAVQTFKDQVRQMAAALVDLQLSGADSKEDLQDGRTPVLSMEQLKELLANSGKLVELREALRRCSVAVAMEQHRRGIGGTQLSNEEQASLLIDLHAALESALAEALRGSTTSSTTGGGPPTEPGHGLQGDSAQASRGAHKGEDDEAAEGSGYKMQRVKWLAQLGRLRRLARESEASGALRRAEALHQRTIILASKPPPGAEQGSTQHTSQLSPQHSPPTAPHDISSISAATEQGSQAQQALHAYATFCMRCGHEKHGRAEQALREALGLPPARCSTAWAAGTDKDVDASADQNGYSSVTKHVPSLTALTALMLHHGRVTDGMLLEEAAELARQLVAALRGSKQEPLAWALLHMVCQAAGDSARAEDIAACLEGLQHAEATGLMPVTALHPPQNPSPQSQPAPDAEHATAEGGADASASHEVSPPQLRSTGGIPVPNPQHLSAEPSKHSRASEGAASEDAAHSTQPQEPDQAPLCLAPGAHPCTVNGLLALALLCATELALPAVALAALQQAGAELQESSCLAPVAAEMELAAAHAYRWMYCWEEALAATSDSRFGAGEADDDGAADMGLAMGGSDWDRAAEAEAGVERGQPESALSEMQEGEHEGAVNTHQARDSDHHEGDQGSVQGHQKLQQGSGESMADTAVRSKRAASMAGVAASGGAEAAAAALANMMAMAPENGGVREKAGRASTTGGAAALQRGSVRGSVAGEGGEAHDGASGDGEGVGVDAAGAARARAAAVLQSALGLCGSAGLHFSSVGPGPGDCTGPGDAGRGDVQAAMLAGELLCRGQHWHEAVHKLAAALSALMSPTIGDGGSAKDGQPGGGAAMPLALVLQLGESFEKLGRSDEALNLYLQACTRMPCATLWLRAGRAHQQLGQQSECEAAFAEAVSLDAENPYVWAALALVSLRSPGQAESGGRAALACALRLGLEDVELLRMLSVACSEAGLQAEALSCLEAAVEMAPTRGALAVVTRLQLAQALVEAHDFKLAAVCYEAALPMCTSERQRLRVSRHLLAAKMLVQG